MPLWWRMRRDREAADGVGLVLALPGLVADVDVAWARRQIRDFPREDLAGGRAPRVSVEQAVIVAQFQHAAARILDAALRQWEAAR